MIPIAKAGPHGLFITWYGKRLSQSAGDTFLIDLLIVFAFVVYSVGSGFYHRAKASENLEEYFLAGRSIRGWRAGFSLAATQFAADTPLLVTGLIATGGIFRLWRLWIYGRGCLMIGFLL